MREGSTPKPGFVIVAEWRVRPGNESIVLELLGRLECASREESGCLAIEGFVSRTDPALIALVERYIDREAFIAHRASGHFRSVMTEGIAPLLERRDVTAHLPTTI